MYEQFEPEYIFTFGSGSNNSLRGKVTEQEWKQIAGAVCITCVIGTLTNLLSLAYFLKRWSNRVGEVLLVNLNVLDLLLNITDGIFLVTYCYDPTPGGSTRTSVVILKNFYWTFVELSSFATVVLTVTRAISSCNPFYKIRKSRLISVMSVYYIIIMMKYSTYSIFSEVEYLNYILDMIMAPSLGLNVVIVISANTAAIFRLVDTSGKRTLGCVNKYNKQATITILILSLMFCFFNLFYLVVFVRYLLGLETVSPVFRNCVVVMSIPANSAINPIIYLVRKQEMRRFICDLMTSSGCGYGVN